MIPFTVQELKSLFYSSLDHKKGHVVINKRFVSSVFQKGTNEVEVTMSSGEKFNLALNAESFAHFTTLLKELEHKNNEVKNP